MHQREQENCAQRRRLASKLLDISTEISTSRNLIEAASMAAHNLADHERDPLVELLSIVSDRLKAVSAEIVVEAKQEASDDAS